MNLDLLIDIDKSLNIECHTVSVPEECGSVLKKYPIQVLHVNVRSMYCNFDNFLIILARLGIPFDVIVMSECWIKPSSTIRQIDGYTSGNTQKYINKAGGVVAYVKDKWSPNFLEPDIDEANCLIVEVPNVFTVLETSFTRNTEGSQMTKTRNVSTPDTATSMFHFFES
ncbi:hypothetical protein ABMA28_007270 [Loxostege sticticalis]|uniref:Uncharacterized protein n=1 Tax=Loxostege sticticalis TaxID=481309 RepID=A0ABD0TQ26_LOXSC